ncbi:MAG: dihydrodipicolinate synthase family protein [Defluviitaleaceae bacterium]|nr:dihydrodipicolinate synthase family protein [Defluviitaleaceae bacterium]
MMQTQKQLHIKKEVWPVMLTPFTDAGSIDYNGVLELIEWYQHAGVDGLFAVCQSSEMFFLSLDERVQLAAFVKKHARIPVIACGHISTDIASQIDELRRLGDTGIDALVLVTNRLAPENSTTAKWQDSLAQILNGLDSNLPLGLYECPYPYKRLLSDDEVAFCNATGRFYFLKDTCCNIDILQRRLQILEGGRLRLYNANTVTLLDSYHSGAAGFSGVMANFHPELYVSLAQIWQDAKQATLLQSLLSICSRIETQLYPVNAKYHLQQLGLPIGTHTRSRNHLELSDLFKEEIRQMNTLVEWVKNELIRIPS